MISNTPPTNFRYHSSNIAVSAAPNVHEMSFVTSQGYRKFICVGSFPVYVDRDSARASGISLTHFPVPGDLGLHKGETEDVLTSVLDFICKHHTESKLFLFDDTGNAQASVVCALLRRIEGWCKYSALEEFLKSDLANNSRADCIKFICEFGLERWNA